jgi:hypothetical protein
MFVQTDFYQYEPNIVAYIMTLLSLKAGLCEWGDRAYDAAFAEMKQLHMQHTFKPKHWHKLTQHQKDTILESHQFIKEERDKTLKGCTVVGGNRQCDYILKEDASSPTIAVESVMTVLE